VVRKQPDQISRISTFVSRKRAARWVKSSCLGSHNISRLISASLFVCRVQECSHVGNTIFALWRSFDKSFGISTLLCWFCP
jgi:hypothetical protein